MTNSKIENETKLQEKIEALVLNILEDKNILNQLRIALELDKDVQIVGLNFKTEAYDKFGKLQGNRVLCEANLKRLAKSIDENGFKSSQPITIDENKSLVNGQHRHKICETKKIPVVFNVETSTQDSLKITQDFNKYQKNWSLLDFVNSYADRGFDDYIRLLDLVEAENITLSLAIWLLYRSRNGVVQSQIRNGELRCSDADIISIQRVLRHLVEIKECIPDNLPEEKKLRDAIFSDKLAVPLSVIMSESNYNHQRMLKQVRELYNSIDRRNMSSAGESFCSIYNYRLKDSSGRLRLYAQMGALG